MCKRLISWFILIFSVAVPMANAAEDKAGPDPAIEDEKVIVVMEILELMEVLDDMSLLKDMQYLMEEDQNVPQK